MQLVASLQESPAPLHTQLTLVDFLFISLCLHNLYSFHFGIFANVEILSTKTESKFKKKKTGRKETSSKIVIV